MAIIDPLKGSQPIIYEEYSKNSDLPSRKIILCVNGEIYNYKQLRSECFSYNFKTDSDCEVIIALYLKYISANIKKTQKINMIDINTILSKLDGQFSFTLYDNLYDVLLIARDPIGITSLYYGFDECNNLMISSEMKGLHLCNFVAPFPNGNYLCLVSEELKTNALKSFESIINEEQHNLKFIKYYALSEVGNWNSKSMENNLISKAINETEKQFENSIYEKIRELFTNSAKRLMSDVPFGVLLSGGLDSSLVSSITTKLVKDGEIDLKWGNRIHSFAIGLDNGTAPDLEKATETAEFLNTIHHNFTFTIQEGLDAVKDVIYHLETYDITTVRASTPMYLLSRKIKAMGVKMVLSGEGSDELMGGYLYFLNAPNNKEFFLECKRRVEELSYFDCMRANKSTLAWGLESRVPFLDKEFIDLCFEIPSSMKRQENIEKYVLRKAFDINDESGKPIYLPKNILWRQKEQFGDGVGYSWIDPTRDLGESTVSDSDFAKRDELYPINTPTTKEAFMFRRVFEDLFPNRASTVKKWVPRLIDGVGSDPSGRAQKYIKVLLIFLTIFKFIIFLI